ncbi:hypothetical protein BH24ACT2_BH24ACT2_07180 [soil metagenome]|nr:hypothetical protein [Acidimicrobiia bacterium]
MSGTASPPLDELFSDVRRVADTVLLEGYVLYPYRSSSTKNQLRWQFGVLAPRRQSEATGADPWLQRTECVVELDAGNERALVQVRVRALQVQTRTVERAGDDGFAPVDHLEVDGTRHSSWDEALEQRVDVVDLDVAASGDAGRVVPFTFPGQEQVEVLSDGGGHVTGQVVRRRQQVVGTVTVTVDAVAERPRLRKVRVEVANTTDWCRPESRRDESMPYALVAVHTLLAASGAGFVSMVDPTEVAREAVARCDNVGTFPVLAGAGGGRDVVLSSPIILYDHPEIAPESDVEFCDSTEIDEILALRVLTLTEEEKREARSTDARAAAIVDRCDTMAPEIFERLHGAVRSLRPSGAVDPLDADRVAGPEPSPSGAADGPLPWWEPAVDASVDPWSDRIPIGDSMVGKGTKVRLRPRPGGDAQDFFLVGMDATVAGVFADVDGGRHVAVTLDDDPAAELNLAHGRFRYFHPDEVEPLPTEESSP